MKNVTTLQKIAAGAFLTLLFTTPAEASAKAKQAQLVAKEQAAIEEEKAREMQRQLVAKAARVDVVEAENVDLHLENAGLAAKLAQQAREKAEIQANFDRQLLALRAELDGKGVRIAALEVDLTVEKRDNMRLSQQNQVFMARIREPRLGNDGSVPQTPARRPTPPQSDDD